MTEAYEDIDDTTCVGRGGAVYPEHDYEVTDERDGVRTLLCSRCGAEVIDEEEDSDG